MGRSRYSSPHARVSLEKIYINIAIGSRRKMPILRSTWDSEIDMVNYFQRKTMGKTKSLAAVTVSLDIAKPNYFGTPSFPQ